MEKFSKEHNLVLYDPYDIIYKFTRVPDLKSRFNIVQSIQPPNRMRITNANVYASFRLIGKSFPRIDPASNRAENIVFSPIGVYLPLSLLGAVGASPETEDDLKSLMGFGVGPITDVTDVSWMSLVQHYSHILYCLGVGKANIRNRPNIAMNKPWHYYFDHRILVKNTFKSRKVNAWFKDTLRFLLIYKTVLKLCDSKETQNALLKDSGIDERIRAIIQQNELDFKKTNMVLLSACSFMPFWRATILPQETCLGRFFVTPCHEVTVPMLKFRDLLRFAENYTLTIVGIPTDLYNISLYLLIANGGCTLDELYDKNVSTMSKVEQTLALLLNAAENDVTLTVPNIVMHQTHNMVDVIKRSEFGENILNPKIAQFGGNDDCFRLNAFYQSASIELTHNYEREPVNAFENVVHHLRRSEHLPTKIITADRPFLFILADRLTRGIFLCGQVVNPEIKT